MIRAVCFDMDGVLFDTERRGAQVRREAAEIQGCFLTDEQAQWVGGVTMRQTRALLSSLYPETFDPSLFMADWYARMLVHARESGVPFKPHVRETLQMLRRHGMKLALTSSNAPQMVNAYLDLTGLRDCFDLIFHGGMVTRGKPDPEIYELALAALDIPAAECAGVEDAPSGVEALRRAGMISVMVPDIVPYSDALAPFVDHCIPNLSQLEEVLFGGMY